MNKTHLKQLAILASLIAQGGLSQEPGEICQPGEITRPGLTCQATDKWHYEPPYVLNAKKGDVLLSSSPGMVLGLLRHVSPPQSYSHSGIIIANSPMQIRHATSSEERYGDNLEDDGANGIMPAVLRYGWPGVISETIYDAYEGRYRVSPEGKPYRLGAFNKAAEHGYADVGIIYPVTVKPPPFSEMYDPTIRNRLRSIADQAQLISGHYRFFAYSRADLVGVPAFQARPSSGWAFSEGRDATVCSAFIWTAAKAAGVQLEDAFVEPRDKPHSMDVDGLYVYSEKERQEAAQSLYTSLYDMAYDKAGWLKRLLSDAPDDLANQVCNCFAYDGCETDDKDKDDWKHPGQGFAVSPGDIMNWDAPPYGVYGLNEPIVYLPGEWARVYRWAASEGTANINVNVTYNGGPVIYAAVELFLGGFPIKRTDGDGKVTFVAVPCGDYEIEANLLVSGDTLKAKTLVRVPCSGEVTVDLALTKFIPIPPLRPELIRQVTVQGNLRIVDDDCFADPDTRDFPFYFSTVLDPISKNKQTFQWDKSFEEIRGVVDISVEWYWTAELGYHIQSVVRLTVFDGDDDAQDISQALNTRSEKLRRGNHMHINASDVCDEDDVYVDYDVINAEYEPDP